MAFVPLGDMLKRHVQNRPGVSGPIEASMVVEGAAALLSAHLPKLAPRITVVSYRDATLTVHAASGAAAAELRLREPQVLALLRARFGSGRIVRLRYS